MSGNSRERSEEVTILGKNPDGEALRKVINKLLDERNLRDLHLKHYHMSTSQIKKTYDLLRHSKEDVRSLPACGADMPSLQFDEAET